jgi:hypothetical protein
MSSLVRLPALALPAAAAAAAESFGSKPCTPQAVDLMLEHVFGCLAESLDDEGGSFFGSACTDASSVDVVVSTEGTWLGEMPIGLVAADAGARARHRRRDLRREQMARMPRDNAQRAAAAAAALWLAELPVGVAPRHHRARVRPVCQCFVCQEHPGVAVDMMRMPTCRCFACRYA